MRSAYKYLTIIIIIIIGAIGSIILHNKNEPNNPEDKQKIITIIQHDYEKYKSDKIIDVQFDNTKDHSTYYTFRLITPTKRNEHLNIEVNKFSESQQKFISWQANKDFITIFAIFAFIVLLIIVLSFFN